MYVVAPQPPFAAVRCATSVCRRALADPLTDIANTQCIAAVVTSGRRFDRAVIRDPMGACFALVQG